MKISYDPEVDALYIRLKETTVTTARIEEGVALDYDAANRLAGIEVLDAVKRLDNREASKRFASAVSPGVENAKLRQSMPLKLSAIQMQVLDSLRRVETEEYRLGDWYLGALFTLENPYNPDRISQAAQSLREILEKLPRVTREHDVRLYDFRGMRRGIFKRLVKDRDRFADDWKGKIIDAQFAKTLRKIYRYMELNQHPTRKEQIQNAIGRIDPMADQMGFDIQNWKRDAFHGLWSQLEDLSHHRSSENTDERKFRQTVSTLERYVYDLLAPITAQDQQEIQYIMDRTEHSNADADRLYELISRRGANYVFFFRNATDPSWIPFLKGKGFFENPPNAEISPDGYVEFPSWPEIEYLKNVCNEAPEAVIRLLLQLPAVDNPRVYENMVEIALDLDGEQSERLKPKMVEYGSLKRQFFPFQYPKLLAHWMSSGQTEAALELANVLVQFAPDPQAEEKQQQRREIHRDQADPAEKQLALVATQLIPSPRFRSYRKILNEGVRPLAEKEPFTVAQILIDATATMIRLGKHQGDMESDKNSDYSELWCPRLNKPRRDHPDFKESLIHALTYACERVIENEVESIKALDYALRTKQWDVFGRLREHLYALHPTKQTLPWIREFILAHDDYSRRQYGYEFQQMVRLACEHFGSELLTEEERAQIFDEILVGPSRDSFREWTSERLTEDDFHQWRRKFHRRQLRPFAPVLFGKYSDYFQELEADESAAEISDESYLPLRESSEGMVTYRSPRSSQELATLSDQELLDYINKWENEHQDKDDWLIEIDIEALAKAFQVIFRESIISQDQRLDFWLNNRESIHRPIYVRAMINAMQEHVKAKNHEKLGKWFPFCEWVLSHSDPENEDPYGIAQLGDRSSESPRWHTARRAVCDFIEACLEPDSEVPNSDREHMAFLLDMLCAQYDWLLDQEEPTQLNLDDHLIEANDTTRGRALENLVRLGLWVRMHDDKAEIAEVKAILDKRFGSGSDYPLKLTEYAILGRLYQSIFDLDSHWAAASKCFVFPQHEFSAWLQAFASFLSYSYPQKRLFDEIRDEFEFALENLGRFAQQEQLEEEFIVNLGQHIFKYYTWGAFPLDGPGSLLNGFYHATDGKRKHWASLFAYVGRLLHNNGMRLEKTMKNRINGYFKWRLQVGEPLELREFADWLEAKCLDAEWRLKAIQDILHTDNILPDTVSRDDYEEDSGTSCLPADATQALRAMLPDHTPLVVEVFATLTDVSPRSSVIYISADDARAILKAGFEHENESVRKNAEHAQENLFSHGILRHT